MTHFGIAFGTIVAVVIGGAFLYDHSIKDSPAPARPAPSTASVPAEPSSPAPAHVATAQVAVESPKGMTAEVRSIPRETSARKAATKSAPKAAPRQSSSAPSIETAPIAPAETPSPAASNPANDQPAPSTTEAAPPKTEG